MIGRTGLGVDNIDLPAAAARGITVTYVPDYCLREVSDHAMALLLALARKIPLAEQAGAVRPLGAAADRAAAPAGRAGARPVGFGNIPRAVVPKAKAFGLTVITHDPYVSKDVLASAGVEGVSFDDLLARSDFISVHAPLMPATRGLINAAASPR